MYAEMLLVPAPRAWSNLSAHNVHPTLHILVNGLAIHRNWEAFVFVSDGLCKLTRSFLASLRIEALPFTSGQSKARFPESILALGNAALAVPTLSWHALRLLSCLQSIAVAHIRGERSLVC